MSDGSVCSLHSLIVELGLEHFCLLGSQPLPLIRGPHEGIVATSVWKTDHIINNKERKLCDIYCMRPMSRIIYDHNGKTLLTELQLQN